MALRPASSTPSILSALLIFLLSVVTAHPQPQPQPQQPQQQALLTSGGTRLPNCAQSCQLLIQASQACSGTSSADQTAWICFCQSAYLTTLRTSATGICDSACTSPSDLQQVSAWYNTECGADNGASEHIGQGPASTNVASTASSTAGSNSAPSSTGDSDASPSLTPDAPGSWWSSHYQWVAMIIVLAIVLPLISVLGLWLKRRHDRKQDIPRTGFNAGITSHVGIEGKTADPIPAAIGTEAVHPAHTGRDSPARTREAFMPYGYGYNRSESAMGKVAATDTTTNSYQAHDTPDVENARHGKEESNPVPAREPIQPNS